MDYISNLWIKQLLLNKHENNKYLWNKKLKSEQFIIDNNIVIRRSTKQSTDAILISNGFIEGIYAWKFKFKQTNYGTNAFIGVTNENKMLSRNEYCNLYEYSTKMWFGLNLTKQKLYKNGIYIDTNIKIYQDEIIMCLNLQINKLAFVLKNSHGYFNLIGEIEIPSNIKLYPVIYSVYGNAIIQLNHLSTAYFVKTLYNICKNNIIKYIYNNPLNIYTLPIPLSIKTSIFNEMIYLD